MDPHMLQSVKARGKDMATLSWHCLVTNMDGFTQQMCLVIVISFVVFLGLLLGLGWGVGWKEGHWHGPTPGARLLGIWLGYGNPLLALLCHKHGCFHSTYTRLSLSQHLLFPGMILGQGIVD